MSSTSLDVSPQRLVLVGGGHANALIAESLTDDSLEKYYDSFLPRPDVELVLISDSTRVYYSGMIPGAVAGLYNETETFFDLEVYSRARGWNFILGRFVVFP